MPPTSCEHRSSASLLQLRVGENASSCWRIFYNSSCFLHSAGKVDLDTLSVAETAKFYVIKPKRKRLTGGNDRGVLDLDPNGVRRSRRRAALSFAYAPLPGGRFGGSQPVPTPLRSLTNDPCPTHGACAPRTTCTCSKTPGGGHLAPGAGIPAVSSRAFQHFGLK